MFFFLFSALLLFSIFRLYFRLLYAVSVVVSAPILFGFIFSATKLFVYCWLSLLLLLLLLPTVYLTLNLGFVILLKHPKWNAPTHFDSLFHFLRESLSAMEEEGVRTFYILLHRRRKRIPKNRPPFNIVVDVVVVFLCWLANPLAEKTAA